MMSSKPDCKVVLLGKESVGKTSIVTRYLHERFANPYQNTIGAAFGAKQMTAKGKIVTLGIWDTAGSEKYQSMTRMYYRNAQAAIICYDITDAESFEKAKMWINELREIEPNCKLYLSGNKLDLIKENRQMRKLDVHDCGDFADEIGAILFETSSKLNIEISELFQQIADDFVVLYKDKVNLKDVVTLSNTTSVTSNITGQRNNCKC